MFYYILIDYFFVLIDHRAEAQAHTQAQAQAPRAGTCAITGTGAGAVRDTLTGTSTDRRPQTTEHRPQTRPY